METRKLYLGLHGAIERAWRGIHKGAFGPEIVATVGYEDTCLERLFLEE